MSEYSVYNSPNAQRPTQPHALNSDDTIHIALAIHDPLGTYSQHAGVVMASIFENTRSKVTVHILHDDTLTENNRRKFIRTAEKYSQGLELHDVTEYKQRIDKDIAESLGSRFTVGALFRLALQDILSVDKVIYLDCDILVRLDITELWEINIDGYCMAAVIDGNSQHKSAFSSWRVRCRLNGCDSYSYINSGVILMNLAEIRKYRDFFSIAAKWLSTHMHNANNPDQDALNSIFRNSIKLIDSRFNSMNETRTENVIIHSAGMFKTWDFSGRVSQLLYWKTYTRTAWGENSSREELIDAIYSYAKPVIPERRIFPGKIRKIFDVVPEAVSSAKLILRDLYYRIKYRLTRR